MNYILFREQRCNVNSCINLEYSVVNVMLLFTGVMISGHHMDDILRFDL